MNRIAALEALAEKVEAGEAYATMGHTRLCQKAFPSDHPTTREGYATAPAQLAINAWNQGSLDAAKSLHEAMLPRWKVSIVIDARCHVTVRNSTLTAHALHQDTARAWLLAILRALIAKEKSDD